MGAEVMRKGELRAEAPDASVIEPALAAPKIIVVGVGGAGGNALRNIAREGLAGATLAAINTDAQALAQAASTRAVSIGGEATRGLGAGGRPEIGRAAAEESVDAIRDLVAGFDLVFIAAGMGGGTGTGAAPIVGRAARAAGALTLGIVATPFGFEGRHRKTVAERGLAELEHEVDSLIVLPNQNLFRVARETTTLADAFRMSDAVLSSAISGVIELLLKPGLVNLDFADLRTVMSSMGRAVIGIGEASGPGRAAEAAEAALSNALIDEQPLKHACGALVSVTGGPDVTLFDIDAAAGRIREAVDPEANIVFGSTFDAGLGDRLRVFVIAAAPGAATPVQATPAAAPAEAPAREAEPAAAPAIVPTGEAWAIRPSPRYRLSYGALPPDPAPAPPPEPVHSGGLAGACRALVEQSETSLLRSADRLRRTLHAWQGKPREMRPEEIFDAVPDKVRRD